MVVRMVVTRKMQGYIRMYWAMKFIKWTESPQLAFEYCLKLNNKYELDGIGANAFTGVAWTFGNKKNYFIKKKIFYIIIKYKIDNDILILVCLILYKNN